MRFTLAKIAFGSLFCIVVPAVMVALSLALDRALQVPVPFPWWIGVMPLVAGLGLVAGGLITIRTHAGVWPMNAFPPERRVEKGLYALLPHPIYLGFGMAAFGAAVWAQSGAGLSVVWPLSVLATLALYWGYERQDLDRRFGGAARAAIRLPNTAPEPPTGWQRLAVYLFVLLPWAVGYELLARAPVSQAVFTATLDAEHALPVIDIFILPYLAAYPWAVLAPLLAGRAHDLRQFAVAGILATAIGFLLYLCVPVDSPFRTPDGEGTLSRLILLQQGLDSTLTSFPAFHVIWPLLAGHVYAARWASWRTAIRVAVWTMIASCWLTGMHSVLDILCGLIVYRLVRSPEDLWRAVCRLAEKSANSWREWRFGRVRLINHGIYGGLGAAIGFLVAAGLAGPDMVVRIAAVFLAGLAGAGLWERLWIPTSRLHRPFGYFGGLFGCAVACMYFVLTDSGNGWPLAAAICVAAPGVQMLGRIRCLVQGCCHGRPVTGVTGIRYWRPQSRVTSMSDLKGRMLHPTPVYSLLANVVCALVLFRLAWEQAPCGLICGMYLTLMGLARFAEEAWRGEPETPVYGRLRLYQWFAMTSALAGLVVIALPSPGFVPNFDPWTVPGIVGALGVGLVVLIALGVDVPKSARPFSQLT